MHKMMFRLLSQAGIPKLRRISKERLRFKGKGHEYSDVARLLSFYQLWLDDLFPKAKFADGLSIIEKLGHTKRMQTMRREWIEEGKARSTVEDEPDPPSDALVREDGLRLAEGGDDPDVTTVLTVGGTDRPHTPPANSAQEGDLYSATPKAQRATGLPRTSRHTAGAASETAQPEEDELDALLAEDEVLDKTSGNAVASTGTASAPPPVETSFDDEMEVMAEMDLPW